MHREGRPAWETKGQYVTDLLTVEALKIIAEHDPTRPLYLQLSHLAVHPPLEVPDDLESGEFKNITEINRRVYAGMYMKTQRILQ